MQIDKITTLEGKEVWSVWWEDRHAEDENVIRAIMRTGYCNNEISAKLAYDKYKNR